MDSRAIQISEHGVFVGKAGIDVAEIRGASKGELTARKQLVIPRFGKSVGQGPLRKVAIEEGGEISGDIAALRRRKARASRALRAAATLRPLLSRADPGGVQPLPGKAGMDGANGHAAAAEQTAAGPQTGTQPQPKQTGGRPQAGAQPAAEQPAGRRTELRRRLCGAGAKFSAAGDDSRLHGFAETRRSRPAESTTPGPAVCARHNV